MNRRTDFPNLSVRIQGKPLVYLDSAATALKPQVVVDRVNQYYSYENANVHRGSHFLSDQATAAFESARERIRNFLGGTAEDVLVFTKGTTDSINMVAQGYLRPRLNAGDVVVLTQMEHHSNIVPWQMVAQERAARVEFIKLDSNGDLDLVDAKRLLDLKNVRMLAFSHVSNSLGTVNPAKLLCSWAKERGIPTLIDGAQSAAHRPVSFVDLGCDFFAFSGHKMYGPTGIGGLLVRSEVINDLAPTQGGGGMIDEVSITKTTYGAAPARFEAGTPHIEGVIGLGAAVDYLTSLGMQNVHEHSLELTRKLVDGLRSIPSVSILGTPKERAGSVSFNVRGQHHSDIGTLLNEMGIAVRVGHHCTQPLMAACGLKGTVRASLGVYSTESDVDALVAGLRKVVSILGVAE